MPNNLERHIKQIQPFKNEKIKAMIGLLYLSNQCIDKQQHFFKSNGITSQQYNVLRILRGQFPKPSNISLIKDRMLDKMCDASRIVDRLVKLGLVTKEPNLMDKRNSDVMISEAALDLLEVLDQKELLEETPLSKLSDEEIQQFNMLIDKALEY